jgi:hypothetical protein
MNLHPYLPNIVTFPEELRPGDRITNENLEVLEVAQLQSTLTLARKDGALYVAVHEKDRDGRMVTMFAREEGTQRCWSRMDLEFGSSNPNDY